MLPRDSAEFPFPELFKNRVSSGQLRKQNLPAASSTAQLSLVSTTPSFLMLLEASLSLLLSSLPLPLPSLIFPDSFQFCFPAFIPSSSPCTSWLLQEAFLELIVFLRSSWPPSLFVSSTSSPPTWIVNMRATLCNNSPVLKSKKLPTF